jgi:hypothetical protein
MASHKDDDHHHEHGSELSEMQLRVRALESILTEKGYVDSAALDAIIEAYETKIGPHNGARVVAKAWTDPAFKRALLEDGSKTVGALGHVSRVGDHLVVIENTPERHNMVVCTLCSCYPWEMLGLRRSGTSRRPTARARSRTRAACSPISASRCRRTPKSGSGIRPRRRAFLYCRCGRPAPGAGARNGSPNSSPATP